MNLQETIYTEIYGSNYEARLYSKIDYCVALLLNKHVTFDELADLAILHKLDLNHPRDITSVNFMSTAGRNIATYIPALDSMHVWDGPDGQGREYGFPVDDTENIHARKASHWAILMFNKYRHDPVGRLVRFINPSPKEIIARDAGIRMRVVWMDMPRMMVRSTGTGLSIEPTQILNVSDVMFEEE